MKNPSQASVAQRAFQIWQDYGSPNGRDTEIWLEAERQLQAEDGANGEGESSPQTENGQGNGGGKKTAFAKRVQGEMASESEAEFHISPPLTEQEAIKAALQKKESRAPQTPTKQAPSLTPPQSGKPVWDKPHSR